MRTAHKLTLYAAGLAGVLGVSLAVGAAAEPTGLANAQPAEEHESRMPEGMVPGLAAADADYRLIPSTDTAPGARPGTFRFRIEDMDGPVTEFDIEHTKPMHLIVVRRDFVGFQHLHPEMRDDGTWETPVDLEDAGTYRVFADFVIDGDKHTLGTDLFVAGGQVPRPLPAVDHIADAADGYTVELAGAPVTGAESELEFVVRHDGDIVTDLPEYLGARGHLVALRDGDLAYLHVHPLDDHPAGPVHFAVEVPSSGTYALFFDFQVDGAVHTASFVLDVTASTGSGHSGGDH
jgi:hypothetical protein